MSRAIYLIGPPGVGKTTVMDALLEDYERAPQMRLRNLLWGEPLVDLSGEVQGMHLGFRRDTFGGTDVLGMAVQRDAVGWLEGGTYPLLFGEGQRLGNAPFLTALAKHYDLTVVYLNAPHDILSRRCEERGSRQNVTWRNGSATRAANAAQRAREAGVRVEDVNASLPLDEVVKRVRGVSGL